MPRPRKTDLTSTARDWTARSPATHSLRSEVARERARELRKNMSPPERLLWTRLKGAALGVRVRRQHPLGPFIADFYIASARLVIEIDGMCHEGRAPEDAARSDYLRAHGIEVIRFTGRAVMNDVAQVVGAIRYALERRTSPAEESRKE